MTTIFLCHASEDKATAEPIQLALSSAGYEVFYDENSLPPGEEFNNHIYEAIQQCDLFIFLVSKASTEEGKYTLSEMEFARKKWPNPSNKVLAVNIEAIPKKEIPHYLTATTILSVKGNPAAEVLASANALLKEKRKRKPKNLLTLTIAVGTVALTISFTTLRINTTSNHPSEECRIGVGVPDFDGDKCIDSYDFPQNNKIRVLLNGRKAVETTPDYEYMFKNTGFLLEGDFNGDKLTDIAHVVTSNVDDPWYVHVHFSDKDNPGAFIRPTRYDFRNISNPKYDATSGHWNANDFDHDGLVDLIHDSKQGPGKRFWRSLGDGNFIEVPLGN